MIEKIKDINPSIPGMLIVQLLYLIVGEALIICIAKTPLKPAIGSYEFTYKKGSVWRGEYKHYIYIRLCNTSYSDACYVYSIVCF